MKFFKMILPVLAFAYSTGFAQTNKEILTSAPWNITGLGIDKEGDGQIEQNLWKSCRTGSTLTFKKYGNGTNFKGNSPCNPKAPKTSNFTWIMQNDNTLIYSETGHSETVTIKMITSNTLTLYFTKSHVVFNLSKP